LFFARESARKGTKKRKFLINFEHIWRPFARFRGQKFLNAFNWQLELIKLKTKFRNRSRRSRSGFRT